MNNFTFLGVEAPVWQGAKVQKYVDISSFRNAVRWDESAVKNAKLFIYRPLALNDFRNASTRLRFAPKSK